MIEIVNLDACISCNKCVEVCPTDVFDSLNGTPEITRQSDCQTCFMCEAYCPVDALFVHPNQTPLIPDEDLLADNLGKYRAQIGWGKGRKLGARTAIGPRMD